MVLKTEGLSKSKGVKKLEPQVLTEWTLASEAMSDGASNLTEDQ